MLFQPLTIVISFCFYSLTIQCDYINVNTTPVTAATISDRVLLFSSEQLQTILPMVSNGNLVFSPFSICVALAMVLIGSADQTKNELSETLFKITRNNDRDVTLALNYLSDFVKSLLYNEQYGLDENGQNVTTLRTRLVNGAFPDLKFHLLPTYLDMIRNSFNASATNDDWENQSNAAIDTVNKFCADNTFGLIPTILSPPLPPLTKLILINTLYFKGQWANPFDKDGTNKDTFHVQDSAIQVSFMTKTSRVKYFSCEKHGYDAIILPYKNNDYSMTIVLPKEGKNFSDFIKLLPPNEIRTIDSKSNYKLVEYTIPVLNEFGFKDNWADILEKKFHMYTTFNDANFSRMVKQDNNTHLKVNLVIQEAKLKMNEYGTEAAAVTAVGIGEATGSVSDPPIPIQFKANRPYLLYLCSKDEERNIYILFIAIVAKPS